MASVRDGELDNICESVTEERTRVNEARNEEKGLLTAALKRMQERKLHAYKHCGIELSRMPGAEKLRVRLVKDQGDAEVSDGSESSSQEDLEPPFANEPEAVNE